MDPVAIDRLKAFHQHLVTLEAAGVPLDLGKCQSSTALILEQILSRLRVRIELGQSIEEAIESEHELPAIYRCAALTLLASGCSTQALEVISRNAGGSRRFRRSLLGAMITPSIIGGLVYAGMISLCLYTAPRFEALYDQIQQPPSVSLLVLRWLREWLPVWAPLAPIVFLIAAWFAYRTDWLRLLRWAPAMKGFVKASNRAAFADQLSRLSENQLPFSVATPLAEEKNLASSWGRSTEKLHAAGNTHLLRNDVSVGSDRLPPLLQWSLDEQDSPEQLTDNLRVTAATYQQAARRRVSYWSLAGPVLASALIGGGVLLAYGCALFTPFASLMEDISKASSYSEIQARPTLVAEGAEQ